MWNEVLSNPAEKNAFYNVLDDYFSSSRHAGEAVPLYEAAFPSPASKQRRVIPAPPVSPPAYASSPSLHPITPTPSSPSPSSVFSARANQVVSAHSTTIANAALQNTAVTSSALRNAGLSPGAANVASKFGAKHSTTLAPHLAGAATNAAKSQWQRNISSGNDGDGNGTAPSSAENDSSTARTGLPPVASNSFAAKSPKTPSGLTSSHTMAGGLSAKSGRDFTRSLLNSKGPMSKEEASKNKFREPIAVKEAMRKPSPFRAGDRNEPISPPPIRSDEIGSARALYDFEGADDEDLIVKTGERVAVLNRVDDDWWRCRSSSGSEGLVPASYLQKES